jgi:hypothetical protein
LTQLSTTNTGKTAKIREKVNEIVAPYFTADLCAKFGTRQRYGAEKLLFTHPFKLNRVAIL